MAVFIFHHTAARTHIDFKYRILRAFRKRANSRRMQKRGEITPNAHYNKFGTPNPPFYNIYT